MNNSAATALALLPFLAAGQTHTSKGIYQRNIYAGLYWMLRQQKNVYYWYYATQVLHNVPGPEWDKWNRQMRRVLIESQSKEGCAAGSWDPGKPYKDAWADAGGRLMLTSLSALTLEVYYRYLPLYKLDTQAALKAARPLSRSIVDKTSNQTVASAMAKPPAELEKDKKAAEQKKTTGKSGDKGATKPVEKPAGQTAEKKGPA